MLQPLAGIAIRWKGLFELYCHGCFCSRIPNEILAAFLLILAKMDDYSSGPDSSMADFQDLYERPTVSATEDRIRAVLGVRNGTPLPKVNSATMLTYYRYLASHFTLPCEARYSSDADGTISVVTLTGLVDPQTMPSDNRAGLCCMAQHRNKAEILPLVDIEVGHDSPNFQFLEDYWFWLWNWRESRSYRPSKPR
ncbi:MAG: hypothetical protein ACLP9L_22965 [Thermoguttaceae bacterium]